MKSNIYILYKYYNSLITKKFKGKDIHNLNHKQLQKYYVKLTLLYTYSKRCYTLREQYRDSLDTNLRDANHELTIDIIKTYNQAVLDKLVEIDEIKEQFSFNKKSLNKTIYEYLQSENCTEEPEEEPEKEDNELVNKPGKVVESDASIKKRKELDDNRFLDDIIRKRQNYDMQLYKDLEGKLTDYNLEYDETILFFIIQELSFKCSEKSFKFLVDSEKKRLQRLIQKQNKKQYTDLLQHITGQVGHCDTDDKIHITVVMGGTGAMGSSRIIVSKNAEIKLILNTLVKMLKLDHDDDYKWRIKNGQEHYLSRHKLYVTKKFNLDISKKVYQQINDEDTLYLHLC